MKDIDYPTYLTLGRLAQGVSKQAYAPYSKYQVGCVIRVSDHVGNTAVHTGCNIENSSFGLTVCAERVALFTYVSTFSKSMPIVDAVVFYAKSPSHCSPCGACLQTLMEFLPPLTPIGHYNGTSIQVWTLRELIPFANPQILDK